LLLYLAAILVAVMGGACVYLLWMVLESDEPEPEVQSGFKRRSSGGEKRGDRVGPTRKAS
jgi:hypothetical protein